MGRRTIEERQEAEYKAVEAFRRRVRLVKSWDDAWSFAVSGPPSGSPGGSHYTNLCYFIRFGQVPQGADEAQSEIYRACRPPRQLTPRGDLAMPQKIREAMTGTKMTDSTFDRAYVFVLALAVAGVVGCGGDDSGSAAAAGTCANPSGLYQYVYTQQGTGTTAPAAIAQQSPPLSRSCPQPCRLTAS